MEKSIEFEKLIAGLKAAGVTVDREAFARDPKAAWEAVTVEARAEVLEALGLEAPAASVALAFAPGANPKNPKAAMILSAPDAPAVAAAPDEPAKKGMFGRGKKNKKDAVQAARDAKDKAKAKADGADDKDKTPKKGLLARLVGNTPGEAAADEAPIGEVTVIPEITNPNVSELERYPVQEPYAFIRILHDKEEHEHIYEVIEPTLSERERNVLEFMEETLVDLIEIGLQELTTGEPEQILRKQVDEIIYDYSIVLSPLSKQKLLYYILRDFLGFGKLDPIMRDGMIEDVSCDGPAIPIFLYHRKYESLKSNIEFKDDTELDSYVIRMAQRSGKHVSIAEPLLDATLPDGSRLNATLSDEVTANGSTFTIRKFKEDPFTPPDLVRFGTMNADILAYWWMAVQNGASAIYAGGTASGKTTSLNSILLFIPPQMKIVSIEDTREVNLPHQNWIAGVTRSGFGPRDNQGRQAGEIDMFTLLKAALRQRPEYILVGEVRGQEATALFQAMATGHTAYGTMHADSAEAVIHRLESEPISIPRSLLEALDIVSIQIQTRIGDRRVRRTKEIIEIVGLDPHTREILTNEVFTWDPATDTYGFSGVSYVLERIQMERNMNEATMRQEMATRKEIIEYMVEAGVRDIKSVAKIIVSYYKAPERTLATIREHRDALRAAKAAEEAAKDAQAGAEALGNVQAAEAAARVAVAAMETGEALRADAPMSLEVAPVEALPDAPPAMEPAPGEMPFAEAAAPEPEPAPVAEPEPAPVAEPEPAPMPLAEPMPPADPEPAPMPEAAPDSRTLVPDEPPRPEPAAAPVAAPAPAPPKKRAPRKRRVDIGAPRETPAPAAASPAPVEPTPAPGIATPKKKKPESDLAAEPARAATTDESEG